MLRCCNAMGKERKMGSEGEGNGQGEGSEGGGVNIAWP